MIQLKLAVGSTDDPAEREADAVAEQVVGRIRRGITEHGDTPSTDVRRVPAGRIRRNADVGHAGGAVDDDTEQGSSVVAVAASHSQVTWLRR